MTRLAVVEKEKCNQERCGGLLCAKVCPVNKVGKDCVYEGEDRKARIDEELCIGCNICVIKCPTDAISVINLPEELEDTPIHRYGVDQHLFALYNLPIPVFGKVVGLIGRNGIGKSTAIKILAGTLKPNFGEAGKEASVKELIAGCKGSEAQMYFEKLQANDIRIAYKPQMVEQIPRAYSGTVGNLLRKTCERDALFQQIIDDMELQHLLDRDINVISGGELQRVAIAATALKDANVYFFDEPTSYLDIKQRLKIAKFIKSLVSENVAVMVVEHDLIILDYLTDLIHIVYGKENVYGIVSHPRASKNGINTYLSGFMSDENVRFRDHKIQFSAKPPFDAKNDQLLVRWPAITKNLGDFSLKANSGEIYKHDIIGILGENGIGKTTFINELAEMHIETNRGEGIISYKPQKLDANDDSVAEVLANAMQYDLQLMRPLELHDLLERKLSELSGGQLQRVLIAKALSEEADLYLLDEPSAYLDIEQRLVLSKVLREMMEAKGKAALVIDHDLLFIDYVSQKLIVFEGEPGLSGVANAPTSMETGMNSFLEDLDITFRRDEENRRPRANKPGSQMDREQKSKGKLYYTG